MPRETVGIEVFSCLAVNSVKGESAATLDGHGTHTLKRTVQDEFGLTRMQTARLICRELPGGGFTFLKFTCGAISIAPYGATALSRTAVALNSWL